MVYTVSYHPDTRCIKVRVEGDLTLALLQQFAAEVADLMRRTGARYVINDLRAARLPTGGFAIYEMPDLAQISGVAPRCKRALIVGDRGDEFYFLETIFLNRGHLVRMFATEEEAREWLFGPAYKPTTSKVDCHAR